MIVIFGSEGLMGLEIVNQCKKRNLVYKGFNHSNGDITDYKLVEKLIKDNKPDVIINCVGMVGVSKCDKNKSLAIKVNCDAVLNLSRLCHKYDITLVQLSTIGVFSKGVFSVEKDEPSPDTLYTSTKLLAERNVLSNCHRYYVIRLPFIFGKLESGGTLANLISLVKENKSVTGDINSVFRFGYSRDMASCIVDILQSYPYGVYHIYNEGYGSMYDFLKYSKKILKSNATINKRIKDNHTFIVSVDTKYMKSQRTYKEAMKEVYG